MKMKVIVTKIGMCILTILWLLVFGVISSQTVVASEKDKIQAFVSILPQSYLVDRIGGEDVEVTVLVGPGQSPATYDPTPHNMAHFSDAEVFFKIGVPFEKRLLEKAIKLFPDLHLIDTQKGIKLRHMEEDSDHGDHHHAGGDDPHTWLDPHLFKIQAETICAELKRLRPERADQFDKNLSVLRDDLEQLDTYLIELMKPMAGNRFYSFHPSYGYFVERYGMHQVAVETAGKGPGARKLAAMIKQAKEDRVNAIFVQKQFATSTAEAIAHEIGAEVVLLDPLAYDYIENLKRMAEKIRASFDANRLTNPETGDEETGNGAEQR